MLICAMAMLGSARAPGRLVVWAWERPEDLRFLGDAADVAIQTGFVVLSGDGVQARGRRFPLRMAGRPSTALVHIQIDRGRPLAWTPDQRREAAQAVLGSAPLRTPEVFAAGAAKAAVERAMVFKTDHRYDKPEPTPPAGAVDVWDEMLDYARAHPADPRLPETLYWLVHVGHYGGSHNHSGKRAFELLHSRYPKSVWAKKTPYYND